MGSVNKVILVGNLGRDAEFPTRRAAARWPRSISRRPKCGTTRGPASRKKPSGIAWCSGGDRRRSLQEYLTKGKQIYVEGRLQTRQWDDKDGNKRYTTEIKADRIALLGGGGGGGVAAMDRGRSRPREDGGDEPPMEPITDDDIPF